MVTRMTMKHHAKKSSVLVLLILAAIFVSAHSSSQNGLATITFPTEPPLSGEPVLVSIYLTDDSGKPLALLDTRHERKLHVIFIGQDLVTVNHTHPEDFEIGFSQQTNGTYLVLHTFPQAGHYAALLDYSANEESHSSTVPFIVVGKENLPNTTYDFSRTKQFGNYTVELKTPTNITTGENEFSLHISNGTPVTDLQMYLGSELHVGVIRADLTLGGHGHAHMLGTSHMDMTGMQHYFGPELPFEYTFSQPGVYALIGQFKHNETVVTTNFLVNVTGEPVHVDEQGHSETLTQDSSFPFSVGWVFIGVGIVILFTAGNKWRKN